MNLAEPIHPVLSRAYGDRGYSSEAIRQHLAAKARRDRMGVGIADTSVVPKHAPMPEPKYVPIPEPQAAKPMVAHPKPQAALSVPKKRIKWSSDRATRRKQIDEVLNAASMRERPPIESPKVKSRAARVVLRAQGENIARETAEAYSITMAQLQGAYRRNNVSSARQEAAYRMRRELHLSFPDIARVLKRKDHTGAMWGVRVHEARLAALKARIEAGA